VDDGDDCKLNDDRMMMMMLVMISIVVYNAASSSVAIDVDENSICTHQDHMFCYLSTIKMNYK